MRVASLDVSGNGLFLDSFLDFRARALDLSANGVGDDALGRFLGVLAGDGSGGSGGSGAPPRGAEEPLDGAGEPSPGPEDEIKCENAQNALDAQDRPEEQDGHNSQIYTNSPADKDHAEQEVENEPQHGVGSAKAAENAEKGEKTARGVDRVDKLSRVDKTDLRESLTSRTSQTSLTASGLPPVGVVIQSASSDARTSTQPPSRAQIVSEFRRERAQSARPAPEAQKSGMFGLVYNPGSVPHRTQPKRPHSCDLLHNSANLDLESELDAESAARVEKKPQKSH